MLRSLTVKNFRRLRDETFTFTGGLNVVRGANEQGKSTMLEAITYSLFGAKACRTPLADMVTWGEEEKTLKVELVFSVEGIEYTIKRGKSGAELNWQGGKVVGQTEVGAFVGRLFGVSAQNVNRLVLSGQGNIRGALGEGSTKTSELIEQLANFSIIDEVVELISTQLLHGATGPLEERAAALTVEVAALEAALVVPDTAADVARVKELEQTIAAVKGETDAMLEEIGPLAERRDALEHLRDKMMGLQERAKLLKEQQDAAAVEVDLHTLAKPKRPSGDRIHELNTMLMDHQNLERRLAGKAVIEAIVYPEDNFFEGTLASFDVEMQETVKVKRELELEQSRLETNIRVNESKRVTSSQCGVCGQDVSRLPDVVKRNAELDAAIAADTAALAEKRRILGDWNTQHQGMSQCERDHRRIQQAAASVLANDVRWDTNVVPHRPAWNFAMADSGLLNPAGVKAEYDRLIAADKAVDAWEARWQALNTAADRALAAHASADAELQKGFPGLEELPALTEHCRQVNESYTALFSTLSQTQTEAAEIQARVASVQAAYESARARVDQVKAQKAEAEKTIDEIVFNTNLLKRVRVARPIIANKLWSMVLTAVSRYFSQMRGSESIVTKDGDGFKVDGKVIEALSGSTLDILGLAIRLALVRTFLPQTPLLILDEPSAACDATRTEAMMAFLVTAGFDQLLLVTHEDMSESVAENLIAI